MSRNNWWNDTGRELELPTLYVNVQIALHREHHVLSLERPVNVVQ
jgi:hypothetical protein